MEAEVRAAYAKALREGRVSTKSSIEYCKEHDIWKFSRDEDWPRIKESEVRCMKFEKRRKEGRDIVLPKGNGNGRQSTNL